MAPRKRRREKGTGSVYQRQDGKWEAALTIQGKLRRRVAPDEQTAKARLAELVELARARVDIDQGSQSMADWFQAYYDRQTRQELKARSLESERELIERYLLPRLGEIRLDRLTPAIIQRTLDEIRMDIAQHTSYDGVRTTHMCARVLRRTCEMAVKRRAIAYSPYLDIILPRHKARDVQPLADDPLRELLRVAAGHRLAALWYTYALLGLRRGEGLGLLWADVDLTNRVVTVRQQIGEINGERVPDTTKTAGGERVLPLIDPLPAMFQAHWEAQQHERQRASWQDEGLVFPNKFGGAIWPHNLGKIFRHLRTEAGVTITIHGLRHGVATMLAEVPVSELIIAAVLGHGDSSITSRYTHPRVAAMRQALEAVAIRVRAGEILEKARSGG
jgi:integrase